VSSFKDPRTKIMRIADGTLKEITTSCLGSSSVCHGLLSPAKLPSTIRISSDKVKKEAKLTGAVVEVAAEICEVRTAEKFDLKVER
jgi:hypothetical protein